ncbi:MAG: Ig-like domain-containing domain, partial [Planctomycetota bacterium]
MSSSLGRFSSFLALILLFAPPATAESAFVRGDVTANGGVEISDAVRIFGYLFLGSPTSLDCADAADTDDSGVVNITDGIAVLSYLFLGATPPAPPFPDCGSDVGEDTLDCARYDPCPDVDPRPFTRIRRTSPGTGELGIAVTRETFVEFDAPIDANSMISGAISAFQGRESLPGRAHLSKDGRRLTYFYADPLPPNARITVIVDGDLLIDQDGRGVDADGDAREGGTLAFSFETLSLTVVPSTAVFGRVFASELSDKPGQPSVNTPLAGVTITVDGREDELRTVTDEKGSFRLDPAPAGRFFVHIDGRTADTGGPPDTYYPFVGKSWTSVPGQAAT